MTESVENCIFKKTGKELLDAIVTETSEGGVLEDMVSPNLTLISRDEEGLTYCGYLKMISFVLQATSKEVSVMLHAQTVPDVARYVFFQYRAAVPNEEWLTRTEEERIDFIENAFAAAQLAQPMLAECIKIHASHTVFSVHKHMWMMAALLYRDVGKSLMGINLEYERDDGRNILTGKSKDELGEFIVNVTATGDTPPKLECHFVATDGDKGGTVNLKEISIKPGTTIVKVATMLQHQIDAFFRPHIAKRVEAINRRYEDKSKAD